MLSKYSQKLLKKHFRNIVENYQNTDKTLPNKFQSYWLFKRKNSYGQTKLQSWELFKQTDLLDRTNLQFCWLFGQTDPFGQITAFLYVVQKGWSLGTNFITKQNHIITNVFTYHQKTKMQNKSSPSTSPRHQQTKLQTKSYSTINHHTKAN